MKHLGVLARFFTSLEWWELIPDPSVFAEGTGSGEALNAAMRSDAGDRILAYLSNPSTVSLRLDRITTSDKARAVWVDPKTGERAAIGELPTEGTRSFTTPGGWQDALLLVEALRR